MSSICRSAMLQSAQAWMPSITPPQLYATVVKTAAATKKFIEIPKNGLYTPVILVNGRIAGNWKRTFVKNKVKVDVKLFRKLSPVEKNKLDAEMARFARFTEG